MRIRLGLLAVILGASPGVAKPKLPEGLKWQTNTSDPLFASPAAQKGGTFDQHILSFPPTLRTVGPQSNSGFRSLILDNNLGLLELHPNTRNLIPALATHWAFGDDNASMYFRLDKDARWSDGKPVKATDFAYTLTFMRSKHIVAPWYNEYYSQQLDKVVIYDPHTISVHTKAPKPDIHLWVTIAPTPEHVYGELAPGHPQKYNWKIVPNTGPYQISKIRKGRSITFKRKKDWWAKDRRYFKHRFNVDKVVYKEITSIELAYQHFLKGKLPVFGLTLPDYWHNKTSSEAFEKGYIRRLWFYNELPRPTYGMIFNVKKPLFRDQKVRVALQHAMDMDGMIKNVLRGEYERMHTISTGFGEYTNQKIRARRFDLGKVDELMAAAGWGKRGSDGIRVKDGQRMAFSLVYGTSLHTPRLSYLKERAKKAGVEINLRLMDGSAMYKLSQGKEHEALWSALVPNERPQYWGQWHKVNAKPDTNNLCMIEDDLLSQWSEEYRNATESATRIRLAHKIQERIHEVACWVPGYVVPYFRTGYWRGWRLPKVPATRRSDGTAFDPFNASWGGLFWYDEAEAEALQKARRAGKDLGGEVVRDTTFRATPAAAGESG